MPSAHEHLHPSHLLTQDAPHMTETAAFIPLDAFLQREGAFVTGGQAKVAIQAGDVTVNGAVETRRKKKLSVGDVVVVGTERFIVTEI